MAATAMMGGEVKNSNAPSIPLNCILCPKCPKFSDISHLLTHISSKSHLHHKFNMEFKAKSEAGAREKLQGFEEWYIAHGIEKLLSERLNAKDQKKSGRRGRSSTSSAKSLQSTSTMDSMRLDLDGGSSFGTPDHIPALNHWNSAPSSAHTAHFHEGREAPYMDMSIYQTPAARRHQSSYFFPDDVSSNTTETKDLHHSLMSDVDSAHNIAPSDVDTSLSIDLLDEAQVNKLKGVVWPAVLATETVWGPEGDVRKVRDIYASPSIDGSPPGTPPRKRKHRPRNNAPSNTATNDILKDDDTANYLGKQRRVSQPTLSDISNTRQARGGAKGTGKGGKKTKADQVDMMNGVHDSGISLSDQEQKDSFRVFYEGSRNSPDATGSPLGSGIHDSGFDTASSYFKHTSGRFFDGGAESPHLPFHPRPPSYGGGFHGMGNNSLGSLCSQPSASGMLYQSFDNHLFNGSSSSDSPAAPFSGTGARRLGFGGFGLDPNANPFGFGDQRESGLRETGFSDTGFRNTSGLFDL